MFRKILSLSILLLITCFAGAARATVSGSLWDLSGVATARVGPFSESVPATGMLALNDDRTYLFQMDGDDVAEAGAWFEVKGKLQLYTQNLLELILGLEEDLAAEIGEPVEVAPLKSKSKISMNSKTGLLEVRSDTAYQVFLPRSNVTVKVTVRLIMKGTRV